jgi:hypothetical protein
MAGASSALDILFHTYLRVIAQRSRDTLLRHNTQRFRRGSVLSIVDLQAAIKRYLAEHNSKPKPFIWTASVASILANLDRLSVASV